MKVLIIYGTTKGQTEKIATHIALTMKDGGDEADVVDGRAIPTDFALAPYDG